MAETHFSGPVSSYHIFPGYQPGVYYSSSGLLVGTGGGFPNGSMRLCPISIHREVTVDRIGVNLLTVGADAGAMTRLCLYTNSPTGYRPDQLIIDAGSFPSGTGATIGANLLTISLRLPSGLYWAGAVNQGVVGAAPISAYWTGLDVVNLTPLSVSSVVNVGYAQNSVTGELPGKLISPAISSTATRVFLRVQSVN